MILADHLGAGDYGMTRAVFVALVVVALGIAAASVVIARRWTRALGLAISGVLLLVAVRMHFRWEVITDAADVMTSSRGASGPGVQLSDVDDFARTVAGSGAVLWIVWMLLFMLVAMAVHEHRQRPTSQTSPSGRAKGPEAGVQVQ